MAGNGNPIGPFRPGDGGMPPYLAGRETQKSLFRRLIAALAGGFPPPGEVILYGPRGNGKTALLVWLTHEVAVLPGVEAVRLTPPEIRTPTELAEQLLPDSFWSKMAPTGVSLAGITWRRGRKKRPPTAKQVLTDRAARKPLVLLLDEAHTLDREVGPALLNASQEAGREHPFLLVLAGTPNLQDHLATMGVSFWNRAEHVPVNRLDEAASSAAIERPLADEDIAIEQEALGAIVAASHGYPFFLQVWGEMVWRQARDAGLERITTAEVEAVRPAFEERRGIYYLRRFDELRKAGLLQAGRALADAFTENELLDEDRLEAAIRRGLGVGADPEQREKAADVLRQLGFLWRSGADPRWEPGIPSLMDYMREFAPSP